MEMKIDNLKLEKIFIINGIIDMVKIGEGGTVFGQGEAIGVSRKKDLLLSPGESGNSTGDRTIIYQLDHFLYNNNIRQSDAIMNIKYVIYDGYIDVTKICRDDLKEICGSVEINCDLMFCDMTGKYMDTYEEFIVDSQDFKKILYDNMGKYIYIELEIYNSEDNSKNLIFNREISRDITLEKELIFSGKIIDTKRSYHYKPELRNKIVILEEYEKIGFLSNKKVIEKKDTILLYEIEQEINRLKKLYDNIISNVNYVIRDYAMNSENTTANALTNVNGNIKVEYIENNYYNNMGEVFKVGDVDFLEILNKKAGQYIYLEISLYGEDKKTKNCCCCR